MYLLKMFIVKYNTEKYIEHISSLTSYYKADISGTIIQVKKQRVASISDVSYILSFNSSYP